MVMVVPENRGPLPRGLECQHPTEVAGVIAIFRRQSHSFQIADDSRVIARRPN